MTDNRLDARLQLVADRQRRRVIRRLREETDGRASVDALVDDLFSDEPLRVTDDAMDRNEVFVRLVHTHLPKLADHGVVEYDRGTGRVQYRPDEQVEAVLDALPERELRAES